MARLFRILRTVLIVLVAIVGIGLATVLLAFPRRQPASDLTVEPTAARLERGRYLVEHVANCLDCHSERDWNYYGGPVIRGTEGRGAPLRVLRPRIESANITPAALGEWSDGEIARAITSGIGRDGRALHPFMPYGTYARMSQEDISAVVSYLRALPPIEHTAPRPEDSWPIRLIGRILPRPYVAPEPVDRDDIVAYGRYLAEIAECSFCHGSDFSGGRVFRIPGTEQERPSENITPHPSNRIGAWARENFVGVFKSFAPPDGNKIPAAEINTVMPWSRYAGMTEEDLGAIYEYLRTIEPVEQDLPERKPAAESAARTSSPGHPRNCYGGLSVSLRSIFGVKISQKTTALLFMNAERNGVTVERYLNYILPRALEEDSRRLRGVDSQEEARALSGAASEFERY